jgi:hypothetical protein
MSSSSIFKITGDANEGFTLFLNDIKKKHYKQIRDIYTYLQKSYLPFISPDMSRKELVKIVKASKDSGWVFEISNENEIIDSDDKDDEKEPNTELEEIKLENISLKKQIDELKTQLIKKNDKPSEDYYTKYFLPTLQKKTNEILDNIAVRSSINEIVDEIIYKSVDISEQPDPIIKESGRGWESDEEVDVIKVNLIDNCFSGCIEVIKIPLKNGESEGKLLNSKTYQQIGYYREWIDDQIPEHLKHDGVVIDPYTNDNLIEYVITDHIDDFLLGSYNEYFYCEDLEILRPTDREILEKWPSD